MAEPRIPPGFDFTDPNLYAHRVPAAEFAELRRASPVWWNAQLRGASGFDDEGYWVVSKHADIVEISRSSELFGSWENTAIIRLGQPQTRRNCRYYRRRFESVGEYVPDVSFPEFQSVAMRMLKQSVVGARRSGVDRALRMLSAAGRPILVGLRRHDGEFLSIIGGWYEFDRAVVIVQMNNERDHPQSSLSLVARGYLIEALIAQGVRRLLFWGGAGAPLDRYCYFLPATGIYLDTLGLVWRTCRGVTARASAFLPRRLAAFASWIEPDAMKAKGGEVVDSLQQLALPNSWK